MPDIWVPGAGMGALLPQWRGETHKAVLRRIREGFFRKYCLGTGLDIGHGGDPVLGTCDLWDKSEGDATKLAGVPDAVYDFVYAGHVLEHLDDPTTALGSWWRVLKPGGFLIVCVPHRDLYEKRTRLPSRWNTDHKRFYLPDRAEPPDTASFRTELESALPDAEIDHFRVCDDGHTIADPNIHSDGEYQIEAVLRKSA